MRHLSTKVVRQILSRCITGSDACAVPVLTPEEAHDFARAYPQVSGTPLYWVNGTSGHILKPGEHTLEILDEIGLSEAEKRQLALDDAIGWSGPRSKL